MTREEAGHAYCMACGAELPLWFTPRADLPVDDADDDRLYALWLDTPCPRCGKTPRACGAR